MTEPCANFANDCEHAAGECDWVFNQIRVWPLINGGSRVEWVLHPQLDDPGPYTYQLQIGLTGNPDADDWTDVGLTADNVCYLLDPTKRVYGKTQWTHYRIVMTTPKDTYTSKPEPSTGVLNRSDYLRSREIERLEMLRLTKEAGQEGYLLKRRLFGTPCSCRDTMTEESRNAQCPDCYGTGFSYGYFAPVDMWAEQKPFRSRNHQDNNRGTIDDASRTTIRMVNSPQVFSYDVWVERDTDYRWIIHQINQKVAVRGRAIVIECEGRLAPFTHPIYRIEIPGQVPA